MGNEKYITMRIALDILNRARVDLDLSDYEKIWGKHLGQHIWRQDGTDMVQLFNGLNVEQKQSFIDYIINKFGSK